MITIEELIQQGEDFAGQIKEFNWVNSNPNIAVLPFLHIRLKKEQNMKNGKPARNYL